MKQILFIFFFISIFSITYANLYNVNKFECELCDIIVYRIDKLLKLNYADEIEKTISKICYTIESRYRENCENIIFNYIEIIDLLNNKTNKNEICNKMNLCNIENNKIINDNDINGNDIDKVLCSTIYYSLKKNFRNINYIFDINDLNFDKLINKTCSKLKKEQIPRCENMFISNLKYFIDNIMNDNNLLDICTNDSNIIVNQLYESKIKENPIIKLDEL
jgi:hypothetical protein